MTKEAPAADAAAQANDTDHIFEDREPKTIIRLVTVGAYMFSVSFAAIALSGYYIFLWHPPNSRLIHAHAAHLRVDSEMDFLVADSLAKFRVNSSHKFGHSNTLEESEINNRYKYISSTIEGVTENNRLTDLENDTDVEVIVQSDEEVTGREAHAKSKRLHVERNNIVKKVDPNMINIMQIKRNSASSINRQPRNDIPTFLDKENDPQPNFSKNIIFSNDIGMGLKPSEGKLSEEDSESAKRELYYSNSGSIRIHKKLFKIL